MRYLVLLLLLSGVCRGQDEFEDYVRVTGYKIIEEYDDGPCSIVSYLKEEGIGNSVSAIQSKDKHLALKLVSLKKEAKKQWPSNNRFCRKGLKGYGTIPNMIVIEINAYRDTIFITEENEAIFLFEEQKEYYDKKGKLKSVLPKDFRHFFGNNPLTALQAEHVNELDSINLKSIKYGTKEIYGLNRKSFEKEFGKFFYITTTIDSLPEIKTNVSYSIYNSTLSFRDNYHKIEKMVNHFPESYDGSYPNEIQLSIEGILPGTEEKQLRKKFPASTQYKFYRGKKTNIEQLDDDYYYEVKISGQKGVVFFRIQKHIVKEIEVEFNYPIR